MGILVNGQSFLVTPGDSVATVISEPVQDLTANMRISNNSNKDIPLRWEVLEHTMSDEWSFQICDLQTCHPIGTFSEFGGLLYQGETNRDFHTQFNAENSFGEGFVKLVLYDSSDSLNSHYVLKFYAAVGDAIDNEDLDAANAAISVFPNPAVNQVNVQIDNGLDVKAIEVYDVVGQLVQRIDALRTESLHSLDISELNEGLYFANILGKDDEWVVTRMFSKVN